MSRRCLASVVTLAAVVAAAASLAGQAAPSALGGTRPGDGWTPILGPDGHPDLQGVWLNNSATPLERPKQLEGRRSLTDAEVAELRRRADRLFKNTNADFAAGDAVYLAALADIDRFTSTTATGTTTVRHLAFGPGPFTLRLDPAAGGWTIAATLRGPFQTS